MQCRQQQSRLLWDMASSAAGCRAVTTQERNLESASFTITPLHEELLKAALQHEWVAMQGSLDPCKKSAVLTHPMPSCHVKSWCRGQQAGCYSPPQVKTGRLEPLAYACFLTRIVLLHLFKIKPTNYTCINKKLPVMPRNI